ncbi:hypothetical protein ACQKWADRAFT_286599 [Trichoderma austrokoningii]
MPSPLYSLFYWALRAFSQPGTSLMSVDSRVTVFFPFFHRYMYLNLVFVSLVVSILTDPLLYSNIFQPGTAFRRHVQLPPVVIYSPLSCHRGF